MNLNEEQLREIESMAELFFSPAEIAANLEVDCDDFIAVLKTEKGLIYQAFTRGQLQTKTKLRDSILSAALNGSSPAQQIMRDLEKQAKI
jgi:hypothetical protein